MLSEHMTEILLLRQLLVLVTMGIASYTDIKKGLIFDKLTLPMMAIGLALNVFEKEFFGIGISVAVFLVGYGVYYAGKIGGGDVKLFTATSMLLPFFGNEPFILSVVFVASIASVVALSSYFLSKYFRRGIDFRENRGSIVKAMLLGAAILFYFAAMLYLGYLKPITVAVIGLPALLGIAFIALEKGIRKNFFLRKVGIERLEEDEIVAIDFLDEKTRKALGLGVKGVLGEKEVQKLKNAGIKEVPVYRQLPPFAPFALAGAIISFLFPGIVRMVIGA